MSYSTGDPRVPTLTVAPADGTTAATLTITAPDGTQTTPTPTGGTGSWTAAAYELTAPGCWTEDWVVTGTGAGRESVEVLVAPGAGEIPTGQRIYATSADYALALQTAPPTGWRRALAAASRQVDDLLLTAYYATDDDGMPADAAVITALRDATVAQAVYNRSIGDPYALGAGRIKQASIGKLSFQTGGSDGAAAPGKYSSDAWSALQLAGLTGYGPGGY